MSPPPDSASPADTGTLDLRRAHAIEADAICRSLGTDPQVGLSDEQVASNRARYGSNALEARDATPWWRALAAQFADPLVYLLLGALAISLVLWVLDGGEHLPFDAIAIAAIVVLNAVIGFVQESRAEQAVAALQQLNAGRAVVRRNNTEVDIASDEVVVGDLLILGEGDAVAADARIMIPAGIQTLEAPLTGESTPIPKDERSVPSETPVADRSNMVFSGTSLAA
ncbi:MAG: cation-translocating P-type ATPase, partial [Acidimicrobiales bacterium]|nr:cation-translocating P-type ATPase [Acidimicrobiales bacterium]